MEQQRDLTAYESVVRGLCRTVQELNAEVIRLYETCFRAQPTGCAIPTPDSGGSLLQMLEEVLVGANATLGLLRYINKELVEALGDLKLL